MGGSVKFKFRKELSFVPWRMVKMVMKDHIDSLQLSEKSHEIPKLIQIMIIYHLVTFPTREGIFLIV